MTCLPHQPTFQGELMKTQGLNAKVFQLQNNYTEGERRILTNLQDSFETELTDAVPKPIVGKDAVENFYNHYKKLQRIKEENDHGQIKGSLEKFNVVDSIQTEMLTKSESLKLLPCKIGIVRFTSDNSNLQLMNQRYGDKYVEVLSEALRYQPTKEINLTNNRIQQGGADKLLPIISRSSKTVDLTSNQIGLLGCVQLQKVLQLKECRIESLILEDNALGDKLVRSLCESLVSHAPLSILNLSKNNITSACCPSIAKVIQTSNNLSQLLLRWNKIQSNGAAILFDVLTLNENVLVFDASYNNFGSSIGIGQKSLEKFLEFLKKNTTLQHLDLSQNNYSLADCNKISEVLKLNHTLYGFHFIGNCGYVDPRGFLITDDMVTETFREIHVAHKINGLLPLNQYKNVPDNFVNICWICEGWNQQTFEWNLDDHQIAEGDPIYIHINFDGFEGIYIPKNSDGFYQYTTMVPPGKTSFFWTVNDMQTVSSGYQQTDHLEGIIKVILFLSHQQNVKIGDRKLHCQVEKLNIINHPKKFTVVTKTGTPMVNVFLVPKQQKEKRVWTFPISIWAKEYKFESNELLRKCFDRDWECSKIPKFVKNAEELEQIREFLWANYKSLKETYKFFSSYNPSGDVWSISSNPLTDFVNQAALVDGKTLKLSDVDLKFIATCSSAIEWKGNFRNPERALVRYQFMEFLVRLAEDKYIKSKITTSILEATKMMLAHCSPVMQFDAHKWRMERYFNENCDDTLKAYRSILNHVYARYSVKKVKPGMKKFMCLDELCDMCSRAGFMDENFVDRDVNMAFNLSMPLEVDELESDRIFQMNQLEFFEAVARIAEKLSPLKYGQESAESFEIRSQQELWIKLEATIIKLLQNCTTEDFREDYSLPSKSLFA